MVKTQRLLATATATALAFAAAGTGLSACAESIYGLTTQNSITIIDSNAVGVSLDGGTVRGLDPNENLMAIDYRAATQGVHLVSDIGNVYTFDANTFQATLVGNCEPPRLPGTSYAFDFNPALSGGEFARLINDTNDHRVISGNTGQYLLPVEKTDVFHDTGDVHFGADPNIAGIAYTNRPGVPTSTQQYGIDATLGALVTVANNAGTLATVGSLGVSPLTHELGLDISGFSGIADASLQSGPNSGLYTVDLTSGAAAFVGAISNQDLIRDLTVIPVPEPATAALLGLGGLAMLRRRA